MKTVLFFVALLVCFRSYAQTLTQLESYFQSAATEFNVPLPILESLGYIETHWQPIPNIAGRSPMGLRNDGLSRFNNNLDSAAYLISKSVATLEDSAYENIRGAAAFLSHLRKEANMDSMVVTDSLVSWTPIIERYSGIPQPDIALEFAYHTLEYVQSGVDTNGIVIALQNINLDNFPDSVKATGFIKPGDPIPSPVWVGSPNYGSRGSAPIVFVIIHDTEEQFDYAHSLFENSSDQASAQYLVRSQDGYTDQFVRDADEAWAVNCWNPITLNIEHEGFVAISDSSFYTETEYESSARLTASLCEKYNIPEDSLHVFGHDAWTYSWFRLIPFYLYTQYVGVMDSCNNHTDPGPYWNWHHYFDLIHSYDTTRATVTGSIPAAGDTAVPAYSNIAINFGKPMEQFSTDSAFSITPDVSGHLSFNPSQTQLVFHADTLLPWSTTFTVRINSSAKGSNLRQVAAPYSFRFTTVPIDTSGPLPLSISPRDGGTSIPKTYVEFIMNEPVDYNSFASRISLVDSAGNRVSLAKDQFLITDNNLALFAVRSSTGLAPGMKYTASLAPGLTDYYGIQSKTSYSTTFTIDTTSSGGSIIEGFESGLGNWQQPSASSGTFGVDTSLSNFGIALKAYDGNDAGSLTYVFDSTEAGCAVENRQGFDISGASSIGMWIFGDGSRNQLDFIFGSPPEKIVPVDTLSWYGYKYVGLLRDKSDASTSLFRGFAVRRLPSALFDSSTIYLDDIQVNGKVTGLQSKVVQPRSFELFQNYPNPFNPTTVISYQLPVTSHVKLNVYDTLGRIVATLIDEKQNAGSYSVTFDASKHPSGVYFYRLSTPNYVKMIKMTLLK